jgi:ssDNA thymidine ADP-ribosyltransferase, DarT
VLQARDFKRDDLDKFEKYQAEALVFKHVPVDALLGIVCYNGAMRDHVRRLADSRGAALDVFARSEWYL